MKIVCEKIEDLPNIAKQIYDYGKEVSIWLLKGEMGAGKTTFVLALTKIIGIHNHVSSPSYSIIHEYKSLKGEKLYHFDFFRVNSISEILDIGFDEYVDSGSLCLIEWPELIENYLTDTYLIIDIKNPDKVMRIYNILKHE